MCLPKRHDENIRIMDNGDEGRCTICGGMFKHTRRYVMINGLNEVVFSTAHRGCLKIMGRIKQRQQEITDLEWKIWLMKVTNNGR
jgi:hypothetical protein